VKLREISATYSLPEWLSGLSRASVTLAARNLHTWTNYRGVDPEVNVANAATSTSAVDQGVVPPLRQYVLSFNYKF
jgi:hypothetical protein